MAGLWRLIVGVGHDPKVVAFARMIALYLVPIGVGAAVAWAAGWRDPRLISLAPLWCGLVRAVGEAVIDQLNKPDMNRADPPH